MRRGNVLSVEQGEIRGEVPGPDVFPGFDDESKAPILQLFWADQRGVVRWPTVTAERTERHPPGMDLGRELEIQRLAYRFPFERCPRPDPGPTMPGVIGRLGPLFRSGDVASRPRRQR